MKPATLLSLLALSAAVGVGLGLHAEVRSLGERLDRLDAGGVAPGAPAGEPAAGPAGLEGGATPRRLAELESAAAELARRLEAAERAAAGPHAAGALPDLAALADQPDFREAVRRQVLDMAAHDVDFRARLGTGQRSKLPKNAPFAQVAETLKLDAVQEAQLGKDLQGIQGELFALLSEERGDGVVPLELIAQVEALPPGDPKRGEVFARLFTLEVPGGGETYMQRAVALVGGLRKRMDAYLRPAQRELLDAVEIDWFSVKFD